MQNNLRLSTSNSEFAKELLATMNDTEEFLIWHSLEDHRILSKAFVSSVESNDDITLIVKFETDKNLAENNFAFKAKISRTFPKSGKLPRNFR